MALACFTASIAWLLDPAIEKMFMEQDKTMMLLIPIAIVIAFAGKGVCLFFDRVILIKVCNEIVQKIGANSIKDMGKIIGELKKNYSDTIDFSKAGSILKELLNKHWNILKNI